MSYNKEIGYARYLDVMEKQGKTPEPPRGFRGKTNDQIFSKIQDTGKGLDKE